MPCATVENMAINSGWSADPVSSWLGEATQRLGIPGASMALRQGASLVTAEAGVLNVDTNDPVTSDSVFQIGSIGKVLTAAIALQLVDEEKLELYGPIGRHLGGLQIGDADASRVTVRQLLDHTSGLPGHYFADFGPGSDSIAQYVDSLATQQMIHPTGAMFSYCNAGYVVAGRLAEVVTGMPFAKLFTERVVEPLGLRLTTTSAADIAPSQMAAGHQVVDDGSHRLADLQTAAWSSAPAGSTMLSTATELVEVGVALSQPGDSRLVSPKALGLMTTPSVDLPCGYWGRQAQCLGWGFDERSETSVLLHGGGTVGHTAMLIAIPSHDLTVAVLTNSANGGRLLAEAERWLSSALGLAGPRRPPEPSHKLTEAEMAELIGTYTDIWTTTTIRQDAEELTLTRKIHKSALTEETQLPPVSLAAIEPRLLTTDSETLLFVGTIPDDPESPVGYLHKLNASRKQSAAFAN